MVGDLDDPNVLDSAAVMTGLSLGSDTNRFCLQTELTERYSRKSKMRRVFMDLLSLLF